MRVFVAATSTSTLSTANEGATHLWEFRPFLLIEARQSRGSEARPRLWRGPPILRVSGRRHWACESQLRSRQAMRELQIVPVEPSEYARSEVDHYLAVIFEPHDSSYRTALNLAFEQIANCSDLIASLEQWALRLHWPGRGALWLRWPGQGALWLHWLGRGALWLRWPGHSHR